MKLIEPIFRKVINDYFDVNKQTNMESKAARNKLVRYIADNIPATIFSCGGDVAFDYPDHMFSKNPSFQDRDFTSKCEFMID